MAQVGVLVVVAALGTGCTLADARPPIARIDLTPAAIPENDDFQTEVVLDASRSADPIDDPEGAERLDVRWEIIGDEARFASGDGATDATPTVTFRGDAPATIRLTVTDADGLEATAVEHLQLTVR
jgi:hypothetical protein